MDLQTTANLLFAAAIAHTGHSLFEPVNIRAKVARLVNYMDKKPVKEIPVNIDTRPKAYLAAAVTLAIIFIPAWLIISAVDPQPKTAMLAAFWLMVLIEVVNTVVIDKYHVEIENVTRRFKDKQ